MQRLYITILLLLLTATASAQQSDYFYTIWIIDPNDSPTSYALDYDFVDTIVRAIDDGTTITAPLGLFSFDNTVMSTTTNTANLIIRPYSGKSLVFDTNTVTANGDISIASDLTVSVDATIGSVLEVNGAANLYGDVELGNATADSITVNGQMASDIVPETDSAYDLGSTTKRWAEIWGDLLTIDSLSLDANTMAATDSNGVSIKDDGGNLGVFVEDGGFVGVGPSATNPENQFEVINTNNTDSTALVQFRQLGTFDASVRLRVPATSWTFGIDNSDSDIFKIENSTVLGGASPAFTLDASGNLTALGSATFGGGYGSTGATISSAGALSMDGALIVGPSGVSGLRFVGGDVGGTEYIQAGADASDTGAKITISRKLSLNNLDEFIVLADDARFSGNVGIGPDTTPDYLLDVQGTLNADGAGTIKQGLTLGDGTDTAAYLTATWDGATNDGTLVYDPANSRFKLNRDIALLGERTTHGDQTGNGYSDEYTVTGTLAGSGTADERFYCRAVSSEVVGATYHYTITFSSDDQDEPGFYYSDLRWGKIAIAGTATNGSIVAREATVDPDGLFTLAGAALTAGSPPYISLGFDNDLATPINYTVHMFVDWSFD